MTKIALFQLYLAQLSPVVAYLLWHCVCLNTRNGLQENKETVTQWTAFARTKKMFMNENIGGGAIVWSLNLLDIILKLFESNKISHHPPKRTWRLAIWIVTNSFEFRRSIQHSQAGFDPPFAEDAEFTEWKTDAPTNQATTAGLTIPLFFCRNAWTPCNRLLLVKVDPFWSVKRTIGRPEECVTSSLQFHMPLIACRVSWFYTMLIQWGSE